MTPWIKIHKKILNWEWFGDSQMVHLFLYLLIKANNIPGKWQGENIQRGQLPFGRKAASQTLGISEQSIRTCLERLKSTNEITIKSTNKYSLITLVNYDHYNGSDKKSTSKSTSKSTFNQPATNQQSTTLIEIKKLRNKEYNKKGGAFAPPQHSEVEKYFIETFTDWPEIKLKSEAAAFFDHFESNGWRVSGKSKMADWKAAARNWKRRSDNFKIIDTRSFKPAEPSTTHKPISQKYVPL